MSDGTKTKLADVGGEDASLFADQLSGGAPLAAEPTPAKEAAEPQKPAKAARKASFEDNIEAALKGDAQGVKTLNAALDRAEGKETPPPPPDKSAPPDEDAAFANQIASETAKMDQKSRDGWSKLRYELREAEKKLRALNAEKEELAKKVSAVPEVEGAVAEKERRIAELAAAVEERERFIEAFKVENSVAYKRDVAEPLTRLESAAVEIAKAHELPESEVLAILRDTAHPQRAEKLSALAGEMPEYNKMRLYRIADDMLAIDGVKRQYSERGKELLTQYEAAERARQEAEQREFAQAWGYAADDAWRGLSERLGGVLDVSDGDAEAKSAVERLRAFATPDRFDTLDLPSRAEVLHRAAVHPVLVRTVDNLKGLTAQKDQEIERLKGELGRYTKATPAAGGGVAPSAGAPESGPKKLNYVTDFERLLAEAATS